MDKEQMETWERNKESLKADLVAQGNFNYGYATFRDEQKKMTFIRLPRILWRSCGVCNCGKCQGGGGFWDTIAAPDNKPTYTVHFPDLKERLEHSSMAERAGRRCFCRDCTGLSR